MFYLWGSPYERGFFCDDESLKHPYKDSTVTNVMLYIVGLGLPVLTVRIFIIILCGLILTRRPSRYFVAYYAINSICMFSVHTLTLYKKTRPYYSFAPLSYPCRWPSKIHKKYRKFFSSLSLANISLVLSIDYVFTNALLLPYILSLCLFKLTFTFSVST